MNELQLIQLHTSQFIQHIYHAYFKTPFKTWFLVDPLTAATHCYKIVGKTTEINMRLVENFERKYRSVLFIFKL